MESHTREVPRKRDSDDLRLLDILPGREGWHAAVAYALTHVNSALLVAGDMQPPLRNLTRFNVAFHDGEVVGVAGAFHGFAEPSVSVAADTANIAAALLERIAPSNGLLAVSAAQPLPAWRELVHWSIDPWLVADCVEQTGLGWTEQVTDPDELGRFYREVDASYWCPAMLEFGGSRILRDEFQNIVAAASVLFVLPEASYAHIGGLVTAPPYRGQGFARKLVADVRATIARAGIRRCGLFADAAHPWLLDVYKRFGFNPVGSFRLADLSNVNASCGSW
jgi:GNAT superfamily N-acetyltransferase